ncbi:hypothetical protein EW145_g8452 [Phellinidium pouzarii]|uniref:Uncharacterized protein n=1 Tax=Phellinidium pouzarii TaxID=167371 RepID=A0A4S4K6Z5_9AGAM|nr:hypothetical protein EW145_g8452 [Phellinidium pouzarii]
MSSDSQSSALLAHIVSQTRSNVDFLVSQNYLQASDAAGILSKLTSIDDSEGSSNPVLSIAERTRQLSIIDRNAGAGMPERAQSPPKAIMPARRNIPPPPPPPPARTQQARALWDYNENGAVSLSTAQEKSESLSLAVTHIDSPGTPAGPERPLLPRRRHHRDSL